MKIKNTLFALYLTNDGNKKKKKKKDLSMRVRRTEDRLS